MKNFREMTFEELTVARSERQEALSDLYDNAKNRELTPEEAVKESRLNRELNQINEQMMSQNREKEHEAVVATRRQQDVNAALRENLAKARRGEVREITLQATSTGLTNNIDASGAINLKVHEMLPTVNEGLGMPKGCNMVEGVTGNEIYPVSIDDVELEETGEVTALTEQELNFANITPTVRRAGITIPVSNAAIDNAAFDLLSFVQKKFSLALKKYLAMKVYSRIPWSGNAGPFSGMAASGAITLGSDAYKSILSAVAAFLDMGFPEDGVCLTIDAVTEAKLKATPKVAGAAGGFVIENGTLAGYPYTVSHYTRSELNTSGSVVSGSGHYLMIGFYNWFALQQHGDVRLTIDATSQAVAKKNVTAVTLNTAFSMTDLSVYINGANGTSQAFACYAIMDDDYEVLADQHVMEIAAGSTDTITAVTNIDGATITYAVTTALSGVSVASSTGVVTVTSGATSGTAVITVTASDGTNSATDTVSIVVD